MSTTTTPERLFLDAARALTSYHAIASDEDAAEQAVTEARELAVEALQRCQDAGAPVLRWMLIATDEVEYLADAFVREAPNAGRICDVGRLLKALDASSGAELCACGHGADEHQDAAPRPCRAGCTLRQEDMIRRLNRGEDITQDPAYGCRCEGWTPGRSS